LKNEVETSRFVGLLLLGVWLPLLLAAPGCDGNKMPTVPVSGRVTFAGGAPPAVGSITFMPHSGTSSAGLPAKPGSAQFDAEGRFKVTSFHEGDGLLPATYGVSISCVEYGQSGDLSGIPVKDYVPQGFRADKLVVKEGDDPIEVTYDVPKKEEG
jgi:hypothetical protein